MTLRVIRLPSHLQWVLPIATLKSAPPPNSERKTKSELQLAHLRGTGYYTERA
jgi:hypothetical protein